MGARNVSLIFCVGWNSHEPETEYRMQVALVTILQNSLTYCEPICVQFAHSLYRDEIAHVPNPPNRGLIQIAGSHQLAHSLYRDEVAHVPNPPNRGLFQIAGSHQPALS